MLNSSNSSKFVLVTGMHRSGTSVLMAGVSKTFGIPVFQQDNPTDDNLKGFFEDRRVAVLNDKILKSLEATWDTFAFGSRFDDSAPHLEPFYNEAQELLEDYCFNQSLRGIKEPRISLLLPFWEKAIHRLGSAIYRIIALRHPMEVAFSQRTRHRQSPESHPHGEDLRYTLNLWFWYNMQLLKALPDDNSIIVEYKNLLGDPVREMQRIGRFINVEPNTNQLREYSESFIDQQLKHYNYSKIDEEPYRAEYNYVFDLYNLITSAAFNERLTKDQSQSIISKMPDVQILQSWAAPLICECKDGFLSPVKAAHLYREIALLKKREQTISKYEQELYSVYTSCSWRYMAPLRMAGRLLRRIRTILYYPKIRVAFKKAYLLLPEAIRYGHMIEGLKAFYKKNEAMQQSGAEVLDKSDSCKKFL